MLQARPSKGKIKLNTDIALQKNWVATMISKQFLWHTLLKKTKVFLHCVRTCFFFTLYVLLSRSSTATQFVMRVYYAVTVPILKPV
jgi:hypothetical protein